MTWFYSCFGFLIGFVVLLVMADAFTLFLSEYKKGPEKDAEGGLNANLPVGIVGCTQPGHRVAIIVLSSSQANATVKSATIDSTKEVKSFTLTLLLQLLTISGLVGFCHRVTQPYRQLIARPSYRPRGHLLLRQTVMPTVSHAFPSCLVLPTTILVTRPPEVIFKKPTDQPTILLTWKPADRQSIPSRSQPTGPT